MEGVDLCSPHPPIQKKIHFFYNVPLDIQFSKENEIQSIPQTSKIHKRGNKTLVLSFTRFKPTKCYLLTLWVNEEINLRINKNPISWSSFSFIKATFKKEWSPSVVVKGCLAFACFRATDFKMKGTEWNITNPEAKRLKPP